MTLDGDMAYALARVHAHQGSSARPADWRRLEAARSLDEYLDAARSSPLAHWLSILERTPDVHGIDRALREAWRGYVAYVAGWHPSAWQPWLDWLKWLPWLSLLAQLRESDPAPAWMMADPVLGPVAPGTLADRLAALAGTPLAVFEAALRGRVELGELWLTQWHARRPGTDEETRDMLTRAVRAIEALIASPVEASVRREQLTSRLGRLFRTAGERIVASLCHLALARLELDRLRGGLITRAVLASS